MGVSRMFRMTIARGSLIRLLSCALAAVFESLAMGARPL